MSKEDNETRVMVAPRVPFEQRRRAAFLVRWALVNMFLTTAACGLTCALNSIRDSESRSSIKRAMRVACARMIPRKRVRAASSLRAGPCSVSMKPDNAASGVRNSWLALATKSARISSTRRSGVRSWNVSNTGRSPPRAPAGTSGAT